MIMELLLAWATELRGVLVILAWIGALAILVGLVLRFINAQVDNDGPIFVKPMGRVALVSLGLMLLSTVPTVDSLWKVRVGLLKLELSSPKNVEALGGHIEEVVKKLECKHLGVNCAVEVK